MKQNTIYIKEQRRDSLVKEIFLLVMLVASLTTALLPFLSATASKTPGPFYIIGGIAFIAFTSLFVYYIYKDFNPNNAMILSPKGFIDLKNIGNDIEIEWTNVSSVKLLGKGTTPFLGISLENTDIIMERMNRNEAELMRENIEDGLPAILISQNDIKTPANQLRDMIVDYVKESRTLHNDIPKKEKKEKKQNPFTTTAVLRAFGQIPEDNTDTIIAEDKKDENNNLSEKDSLFDTVQANISENKLISESNTQFDFEPTESKNEFDDMPDEIKEILNRARSSKISELGKILSEKEVPYSLTREDSAVVTRDAHENTKEEASDIAPETTHASIEAPFVDTAELLIDEDGEISTHMEMTDFITYIHDSDFEKEDNIASDNSFETNLDSMLKTAFDNTRVEIEREDKSIKESAVKSDFDAGFFPELVLFNDIELDEMPDEINAARKYENNEPTDFIANIDDD